MNRDLKAAAAVPGTRERELRNHLRNTGALNHDGTLAAAHVGRGFLFMDPRSRWNPRLNTYSHYAVVMVTEAGIDWLAKRLGITVTRTREKDSAA
ncbi:hypothetical protein D9M70_515800 [compost metagenome]